MSIFILFQFAQLIVPYPAIDPRLQNLEFGYSYLAATADCIHKCVIFQKSAELEQNQPIFIYFEGMVEELVLGSVHNSNFQGQRVDHSRCPFLCLLRRIF